MKRIRLFANRDRVTRTRIAYIALTAGTVAIALLLVFLNRWIFKLSEKGLYDDPKYEAVSIISANSIGAPLSLETRVSLYLACERQGEERAVMPGEMNAEEITAKMKELWGDTLHMHAPSGKLATKESVDTVLRKSRYTAVLRDFYNDSTGAKLALWCVQAYYNASGGKVYCLSAQFDSRTGEAYEVNCVLFGNVQAEQAWDAFIPFLAANGYTDTLADRAILTETQRGFTGTLTLPDGIAVTLTYITNEQYTVTFSM
jgi:Isochorismate hydrolase